MIKSNLSFLCMFLLASLYTTGTQAQTKVWGAGAAAGQAEGEFQNAFTQTGTTGSYSATSWTALSVFENKSNTTTTVTPGAAYWTRSTLGHSQGNYAGTTVITSPSQANGVAIFDSDFLDNGGTANQGTGSSPAGHRGELISPRIDLSGYTDTAIVVQFYSRYRDHIIDELSVSLSTDDGLTWSSAFDYRDFQGANSTDLVRALFSNVTTGVANLSQCRVRFTFEGNYYYAMIDDVTVETAPEYDVAWAPAESNSNNLIRSGNYVKIGGNRYQALKNLDASNLKEWIWGGKIANYGSKTLVPQDSLKMYVSIDFVDPITGNTTPAVYVDSMDVDTLVGGDQIGSAYIERLNDINFIMNNGRGTYRVAYWVSHNQTDQSADNDTLRHIFTITEDYISKARRAASDGKVFANQGIFPGGTNPNYTAFEYGSVYYFPEGATEQIVIDSIDFRYQVPFSYNGPATQTVLVNVYKLNDGSGATPANGRLDGDELLSIGVGTVSLNGLGSSVAGDYRLGTATSLVDPGSGGTMAGLEDDGFYYISVLQDANLGATATFDANSGLWMGADQYNYYLNRAMTRPDTIINPSPSMNTDAAGNVSWFADGFNGGYVPSIGLYISTLLNTNQTYATQEQANMSVFPNPTSAEFNVNVKFEEATDVQYIMTDVSGRVVLLDNSKNVTEETKVINVEQLSAGVYFITARTDKGTTTQRIIKK